MQVETLPKTSKLIKVITLIEECMQVETLPKTSELIKVLYSYRGMYASRNITQDKWID